MSELNQLSNSKYAYLSRFTVEELLDLLSVAPIPAASPEQEAYVDALKEAIIEKENENPTGFFPDPDQQWKQFVTDYLPFAEEAALEPDCVEDAVPERPDRSSIEVPPKRTRRFSRLWRTLLIAAAAVGCMFAAMVTAQAAGFDVFGAMARWTEETFSFRSVPSNIELTENLDRNGGTDGQKRSFSSLQEALDAYGIIQVHEPTQMPDGFAINKCGVEYSDTPYSIILYADYVNNRDRIAINIASYESKPAALTQKTDEPPELKEWNGTTFYVIENSSNAMVAWYDDAYEYYVSGKLDREILWGIAVSMYE